MPAPTHPLRFPDLAVHLVRHDVSRTQLARKVGCSNSYISRVMRGHEVPSDEMKARIAEALDSTVAELFTSAEADAA